MDLISALHMNGRDHGHHSYANNSLLQRRVISKIRPMVEQAIKTMQLNMSFPERCFVMVDLGCSSGPNTFLSVSHVIDAIAELSQQRGKSAPELQVFLNDLPSNDFNSVFLSLSDFYNERHLKPKGDTSSSCYITGTPGSFHGRLFPASSVHLFCSSYSLHCLSKVPQGIENNKGHIYMGKTSPRNVFEAYLNQFQSDFTNFLSNREKEMKQGGAMVLAFIGRSNDDPASKDSGLIWELLSKSLLDMVVEGLIEEGDVDSFNIPVYYPSEGEVKEIVETEGSFNIDRIESFQVNWDEDEIVERENYEFDEQSGNNMANTIRAVAESVLACQFGEGVIEGLFGRYAEYLSDHVSVERANFFSIAISLSKR